MDVLITLGVVTLIGLIVLSASAFTVEQMTNAIIERFGAFARIEKPGLHFKNPFFESVVDTVDLRVQQLDIEVMTKTKDDVTVGIKVAVHYQVLQDDVYKAYYSLEDEEVQIKAYVFDAIRAQVPSQTLDQVYADRELDKAIEGEVRDKMKTYGYHIIDAPVMEIDPDETVKTAMNQVNAQQRLLEAARSKGEADKVITVKAAEAQADSKALQGDGIARERLAIALGLKESAEVFKSVSGVSEDECLRILLMTQYFDMLGKVGSNSNTIMLPHSPGGLADIENQIRTAIISGDKAVKG